MASRQSTKMSKNASVASELYDSSDLSVSSSPSRRPRPSLSERARHPVQIAQKEPIQQPIAAHCRRHHFYRRVLGQCHSLWICSRRCPCLRVLVMKLQKYSHFMVMRNDQILDPQCGETLGTGTLRYPMTALLRKKCVLRGHFERP